MLLVTAICDLDAKEADQVWNIIEHLGGCPNHDLLIVGDITAEREAKGLVERSKSLFKSAALFLPEVTMRGWPQGPNCMFRQTVKHLDNIRNQQPWYFMEPDHVPLKAGWLDLLEEEYRKSGRKYMGALSPTLAKDGRILSTHLNGAAVYPPEFLKLVPAVMTFRDRMAWDIELASHIVPSAHNSELIVKNWRSGNYKRVGSEIIGEAMGHSFEVKPVTSKTVICHGCKDFSLGELVYPGIYKNPL
jgi:hypothetical protein